MLLHHLLLLLHCKEVVGVHAASHLCHIHAHEAHHSAALVAGSGLHRLSLCIDHHSGCIAGVTVPSEILKLLDASLVLLGHGGGVDGDILQHQTTLVKPICLQLLLEGSLDLLVMQSDLVIADAHVRDLSECRLERVEQLGLHLGSQRLTEGIAAGGVACDGREELHRVSQLEGVHTVAADAGSKASAKLRIGHTERHRILGTELVVQDLLDVEEVDALILASLTAVLKFIETFLEGIHDALTQTAGEDRRGGGGIKGVAAGLCADLYNSAVVHDDHALTFIDNDLAAVGDDVLLTLGVGGLVTDLVLALDHQDIVCERIAVEVLQPLVCQCIAQCSCKSFDQTHSKYSPFDISPLRAKSNMNQPNYRNCLHYTILRRDCQSL